MKQRWRVYLGNQHTGCRIYAEADTRPNAFRKAFLKALPCFRHFQLAGPSYFNSKLRCDIAWVQAYRSAVKTMTKGTTTSATHSNPKGFNVEIVRL